MIPFTVTLIGANGSGKSTVTQRLLGSLPMPCRYLYMGVSTASSNRMLPTTRLVHILKHASGSAADAGGPPDPDRVAERPRGLGGRLRKGLRGGLHYAVLVTEEWYRQCLSWWHLLRGRVMLYDRHFFIDYYAHDITRPRDFRQRVHGWMLKYLYPRPQLVILLDAPAEVLFARKQEGSVALLERRRTDYLSLRGVLPHFVVLDASLPLDAVVEQARALIVEFHRNRTAGGAEPG